MATFRAQVPAAGTLLSSANSEARGQDLEALSLTDIYALVGSEPASRTEKRVTSYSPDGTAIVEIETEDDAWAQAAVAALGPLTIRQMRQAPEMKARSFSHTPDGAENVGRNT